MYKTVRHGENSLQYKILAQQEEGTGSVKCRRSRPARGRTAGIVTIVLLLVCGVLATAVLVPLVLTNDFVTLTGTFQKFSVSTLRRSHSGNHVVVIAKKHHGWNSSRQSVFFPPVKSINASAIHLAKKAKQTTVGIELSTAIESEKAVATTPEMIRADGHPETTTTAAAVKVTGSGKEVDSKTDRISSTISAGEDETDSNVGIETESAPTSISVDRETDPTSASNLKVIPSTSPSWYQNRKWTFETPASFISWTKNRLTNDPLSTAVGGISAVAVVVIVIVVLVKSLPDRKKIVQKESAESREDKRRLLKPSARNSDEE